MPNLKTAFLGLAVFCACTLLGNAPECPQRIADYAQLHAQVARAIALRNSPLTINDDIYRGNPSAAPFLPQLPSVVGEDGSSYPVADLIEHEYLLDITANQIDWLESRAQTFATAFKKATGAALEAQAAASLALVPLKGAENGVARSEIKREKEKKKQATHAKVDRLLQEFRNRLRAEGTEAAAVASLAWQRAPVHASSKGQVYEILAEHFNRFCDDVLRTEPYVSLDPVTRDLGRVTTLHFPKSYEYDGRTLRLPISQLKLSVEYDRELSTVVLQRAGKPNPKALQLFLAHGATSYVSNSASWKQMIPYFERHGFDALAVDLPGAMGDFGPGLNNISMPWEIAAYLDRCHAKLRPAHRLIAAGRSFGSTQEFAHAAVRHLSGQKGGMGEVDAYLLTSFSNPDTIDDQVANVEAQARDGSRANVQSVVPGSFERVQSFSRQLSDFLARAKATHPEAIETFGDNIFFVQGEADVDGEGGALSVVDALLGYRNRYAPRAHVYVIPDPLREHPEWADVLDPDAREASHFLFSTRPNLTSRFAPAGMPEALLPKFSDQTIEVIALGHASLDYLIDLSPYTTEDRRRELDQNRRSFTGLEGNFGYFRQYLNTLNEMLKKHGRTVDFEQITSSDCKAGRENLTERLRRVWNFVHAEASQARNVTSRVWAP